MQGSWRGERLGRCAAPFSRRGCVEGPASHFLYDSAPVFARCVCLSRLSRRFWRLPRLFCRKSSIVNRFLRGYEESGKCAFAKQQFNDVGSESVRYERKLAHRKPIDNVRFAARERSLAPGSGRERASTDDPASFQRLLSSAEGDIGGEAHNKTARSIA